MLIKNYYVYMYFDTTNYEPFYIGKGYGSRYTINNHLSSSNLHLVNKIKKLKDNIRIHFLHKNLSEVESFFWEQFWIKVIGRKDLSQGPLCNLTNGGEGNSGKIISEATREKIRIARSKQIITKQTKEKLRLATQKQWDEGKRPRNFSEESRKKLSESCKGRTPWNKGKEHMRGVKNPATKLTENEVIIIKKLFKQKTRICDIARITKINISTISDIVKNRTWKYVSV